MRTRSRTLQFSRAWRCCAGKPSYDEDAECKDSASVEETGLSNPGLGLQTCKAHLDPRQADPCQVPLFTQRLRIMQI